MSRLLQIYKEGKEECSQRAAEIWINTKNLIKKQVKNR